jgi:primosomal protein N' (replication factor Y)
MFWSFAKGDSPIIIGARSALFVPVENPGLIIVDEEHENTYKQEESPAYNLRDMAVLYANVWGIPVILGSATPQAESVHNARAGKYHLHRLHSRPGQSVLADIDMVDLRKHPTVGGIIAEPIYDELCRTVSADKQAILFLNRKGYATSLYCNSCNTLQECLNCSVPLTMYKTGGRVSCHYCGASYPSLKCSACGSDDIRDVGAGTERVEEFIAQMFPDEVIRIDADKVTSLKQLNAALKAFSEKKARILIGTQLVAKGLHFPDVTFVGILGIDNILTMPDFRAAEKAYQLIMQVSGRAGRGDARGSVHIQSNLPDNPLFGYVMNDPDSFYDYELERRRIFNYPPYVKLARLLFSYSKERELADVAQEITAQLRREFQTLAITNAVPAPVYKIKNLYRLSVLIRSASANHMSALLARARELFEAKKKGSMGLKLDRDPYFFI